MLSTNDFSKLYAEEYGVTADNAAEVCTNVWKLLGKVLYTLREDFTIHKVGTFKKQAVAPKRFRHPVTGEVAVRPARSVIKFKASKFPHQMDT